MKTFFFFFLKKTDFRRNRSQLIRLILEAKFRDNPQEKLIILKIYLVPFQTSVMGFLAKIGNGFLKAKLTHYSPVLQFV